MSVQWSRRPLGQRTSSTSSFVDEPRTDDLPFLVGRTETVSSADFEDLRLSRGRCSQAGADGVAVGLHAVQFEKHAMASRGGLVLEQCDRPILVYDDEVWPAVPIPIEPGDAATQVFAAKEFPAVARNVAENSAAQVVEQLRGHLPGNSLVTAVVQMAVGQKYLRAARPGRYRSPGPPHRARAAWLQ